MFSINKRSLTTFPLDFSNCMQDGGLGGDIILLTKEGNMAKKDTTEDIAMDSGKKQALDLAIQQITKQCGKACG